MTLWRQQIRAIIAYLMAFVLVVSLTSCGERAVTQEVPGIYTETAPISKQTQDISETSPPEVIQKLRSSLEKYQPQVVITNPQPDQLISDDTVTIRLQVQDLPIFKNSKLNLGPHLKVILDNQPDIEVYDLTQPLVLNNLAAGTHTLRVFAVRPWGESFKNEGAFALTRFHIFTKTDENNPDPKQPLLTYNSPTDTYGAEPILLDFYLTNAPLHLIAQQNPKDQIADWRIRCTINGESFVLDRWQSLYLKGFKPGNNWIKLEFLDEKGNPVKNVFNSIARVITYDPKAKDTLSQILRGKLSLAEVRGIVEPTYTPPEPTPTIEATPEPPAVEIKPQPEVTPEPQPEATPTVEPSTAPEAEPKPQATPKLPGFFNRRQRPPAKPEVMESPVPQVEETPEIETPIPSPEVTPTVEPIPTPEPETKQPPQLPFRRFFNRRQPSTVEPSPSATPTIPEVTVPQPEEIPTSDRHPL